MVDEYGYELIGFYPVLGGMVNALAVSTRIIIPVQTEFLALKGLDRILKIIDLMKNAHTKLFSYTIILTMFDRLAKTSVSILIKLN